MRRTAAGSLLLVAALAGVAPADAPPRPDGPRPRIVSFAPAITRILFDMGLGDHVVGVTRFCELPEGVERPRLGDAYAINAEQILKAEPDLILAQTSPDKFAVVTRARPEARAVELTLESLAHVGGAIDKIGRLVGRPVLGRQKAAGFRARLDFVRDLVAGRPRPRVLFVTGTERPIIAGRRTFIGDIIDLAGGEDVAGDIPARSRWAMTDLDHIAAARPDVLICHVAEADQQAAREYWSQWTAPDGSRAPWAGRVHIVSDDDWLRPSMRLADLALDMAESIHPECFTRVPHPASEARATPLWIPRLWRLLAAAVVGAALAAAGAALQGLLRNPLAEPYILGVSSGAGVGVLLGLALTGWVAAPRWLTTPVLAFAGALATCAAVYAIAQRRGRLDPYSLILSGVIVNVFNAAIMMTIYLYVDRHRIADFAYWSMGRLPDSTNVLLLAVCAGFALAGWGLLAARGAAFNVLGLGDGVASSSGVAVHGLRIATFACVGLMTAAAVALAGPIGFVGLVVPHVCRMILGPDHRRLLVASGVAGAGLLVGAESLCRTAGPWIGVSLVPVGILTALIGGPFFILLLRRRMREVAP